MDDYLPDAWGRKVLAQLAFYRDRTRITSHSVIDILNYLGNSRIGAVLLVPHGQSPYYELGCDHHFLPETERAAKQIEEDDPSEYNVDDMSLIYLANAGTGVGGARPKALINRGNQAYLAKFNRHSLDKYNNARVELACIHMAQKAGLEIFTGFIESSVNQREVLLLERFDTCADGSRHHVITLNALLKEPTTQKDMGSVFTYNKIVDILRKYSCNIEKDLEQLLRLMLFNGAINNTDDHERNFSLIHRGDGFQLAPAYDLVPSLTLGEYHSAGYQYQPFPPKPSEVKGKIFGLSSVRVKSIAEEVIEAINHWPDFASHVGVSEKDTLAVSSRFQL